MLSRGRSQGKFTQQVTASTLVNDKISPSDAQGSGCLPELWLIHAHLPQGARTSVFLGQVVRHLPVVVAVEDAVGDADVVGCHLVDALWDADDG